MREYSRHVELLNMFGVEAARSGDLLYPSADISEIAGLFIPLGLGLHVPLFRSALLGTHPPF